MAAAIGKHADADHYLNVYNSIRKAFAEKYLKGDGTLTVDNQTACVLALSTGLVPEKQIPIVRQRLLQLLEENEYRMTTGFLGTKPLLFVLTEAGHNDLAARLLQSRQFPSWGYEVINGATSIWERWNSYTKEDGFGNASMNSFSHYSFGAVCQWMLQKLAGIDPGTPGFRKILIEPYIPTSGSNPDHEAINEVHAAYDSIQGRIAVDWRRSEDGLHLLVTVPVNTTATVAIPATAVSQVSEGGSSLENRSDLTVEHVEAERVNVRIGSGTYEFVVAPN
jgi:alpha-L-rhamnosidase